MWDFGLSEGALSSTFLLGSIAAITYFVLIRPQQKQHKQQRDLMGSLKKGDEIILSCGIAGRVHAVDDRFISLEIGDRVRMKVVREAVHAHMDKKTNSSAVVKGSGEMRKIEGGASKGEPSPKPHKSQRGAISR